MKKLIAVFSAFLWMAAAGFAQTTVHTATQDATGGNTFTQRNVFVGPLNYYVDTGAANAYVIATGCGPSTPSCPASLSSLTAGATFTFKAANSNTGASTLAVDSVAAIAIQLNGSALSSGTIVSGHVYSVTYNGTNFDLAGGGGGGGSPAFNTVTGGTNTSAAMLVGTGASLGPTGTGTVTANAASGTLATQIAPNANAFYLSTNCGTQANCYQTSANTQIVTDATFTSGSASVTTGATDPPFVAGDVGKRAQATYACNVAVNNTEKCAGVGCPDTTIASYVSAHSITLSVNCTNSSSGVSGAENRFAWGTADDTAIASLTSAILAKGYGSIRLPCTAMWTEQASFILNRGVTPSQGPISVIGCPSGTVVVFGFNYNYSTCVTNGGCFYDDTLVNASNQYAYEGGNNTLRDVDIQGLGNSCAACSFTNAVSAVHIRNTQTAENVHISGLNWNAPSNFDALLCDGGSVRNYYINAGGRNGIRVIGNTGCYLNGFGYSNDGNAAALRIEASGASAVVNSIQNYYYQDSLNSCAAGSGIQQGIVIVNSPVVFKSTGDVALGVCQLAGTSAFTDTHVFYSGFNINGGTVHAKGVSFATSDSSFGTFYLGGGNLFDDCGNTPVVAVSISSGSLFGSCSITGVAQTSGNIALGAGWGSTAAVSAVSGTDSLQQFTVTAGGTGIAANPTVTITQPTHAWGAGFWAVPICTIGPNQGNDVIADSVLGSVTASSVPFTWEATPTTGKTYTFTVRCQNP